MRIMAIDLGTKRVGIALSDPMRIIAQPYETLTLDGSKKAYAQLLARIAEIVESQSVSEIVVGLPLHMSGQESDASRAARQTALDLEKATAQRVILWDERLSTVSAQKSMRALGVKAKNQKGAIDQMAAQSILQGYMNSLPAAPTPYDDEDADY